LKIHNRGDEILFKRKRQGSIHCYDKCENCQGSFEFSAIQNEFTCSNCHFGQIPSKFRVFYKGHTRRFNNFTEARNYLQYLQQLDEQGKFSKQDYKSQDDLRFDNLADKWLKAIRESFKNKYTWSNYKFIIHKAVDHWQGRNVNNIKLEDIQGFLNTLNVSSKTKHSYNGIIKRFMKWSYRNEYLAKIPEFPKINYKMKLRTTITKEMQLEILDKLLSMTINFTPKIYFAARLCCNYMLRWSDIRYIKESDIDISQGLMFLQSTKTVARKIYLIDEDVSIFKQMLSENLDSYFFRFPENRPIKGVKPGNHFNRHLIYDWWKKASKELYGKPLELYSSTKHSSLTHLHESGYSPEQIIMGSGHLTRDMLKRYLIVKPEFVRQMYQVASGKKWQEKEEDKKPNYFNKIMVGGTGFEPATSTV
jgi:integrase